MFDLLSATGKGLQIGSIGSGFALAAAGVELLPIAAICGAGYLLGRTLD